MPETDVIFKFVGEDDLTPTLDKIKGELDAIAQSAPKIQQATTAQSEFAHQTKETSFAMEQFKELGMGIGYTIGAWNVGFMLAEKAVEFVSDAFKNASTMAQNFTEQMNITRSSTTQEKQALDELKRAAEESGMGLGEDFEKFVMPAVKTLESLGLSEQQAGQEVKVLGQYMRAFGVDMRDLAAKTELGTASFNDLLKAGAALGPMFQKEVLDWTKFEISEAQVNTQLQRYRQLMNEAYSDTQRLASAHEGFAQSTGLAASAFKAFQAAQTLGGGVRTTGWAQIPAELANLPGGGQAFGQLLGEMQRKFKTGIQQLAKEEGLSERLVTAGVKAGLPGFDEQALLGAQKRAVEEREIARHRGEETQDFERRNAAEQERIKLNREVNGILKEQAGYESFAVDRELAFKNYQESIKGTTDKIGEGWTNIGIKIGDAMNILSNKDAKANLEMIQDIQARAARGGTVAGQANLAAFPQSPEMQAYAAKTAAGGKPLATDDGQQKIVDAIDGLKSMLQGH